MVVATTTGTTSGLGVPSGLNVFTAGGVTIIGRIVLSLSLSSPPVSSVSSTSSVSGALDAASLLALNEFTVLLIASVTEFSRLLSEPFNALSKTLNASSSTLSIVAFTLFTTSVTPENAAANEFGVTD